MGDIGCCSHGANAEIYSKVKNNFIFTLNSHRQPFQVEQDFGMLPERLLWCCTHVVPQSQPRSAQPIDEQNTAQCVTQSMAEATL